ncbi:MAG TPA: ABC transporter ATP-binding protein [Anaerolineales bacterium]|nr:ABC transporter ATP-binding protein [Anaerolineales bacterium]
MMDNTATHVIEAQGLSKSYKGVKVLDGVNLQVPRHSIYGFLGPNGAGKSTTIKLLVGLIQPTAGKVAVFGNDVQTHSNEIRKRIGYLAQEPRFYEYMTARQILRYTAKFFYSGPGDLIEERIEEMLEMVGLTEKADRPVKGFSGGERQRLGIAQAQINYPDLIILDEPAAALDPMGRYDVLMVMEKLRQQTTIFYSTHILEDVQRVSDKVAILDKGRLVAQAPIQDLLAGEGAAPVFLLTLKGDLEQAHRRVASQPWVQQVKAVRVNGHVNWEVSVTDADAAEDQLQRLILEDRNLRIVSFKRKTYNLEEVFLNLIEGSK